MAGGWGRQEGDRRSERQGGGEEANRGLQHRKLRPRNVHSTAHTHASRLVHAAALTNNLPSIQPPRFCLPPTVHAHARCPQPPRMGASRRALRGAHATSFGARMLAL
eukprot:366358-Chlamydomonas_euryale.AAC.5